MAKRFTRLNGENMQDFQRRIAMLQAPEKPLSMRQPAKPRKRLLPHERATWGKMADHVDGYDRDDLGHSED